jgi:chromosome segregation ATPase
LNLLKSEQTKSESSVFDLQSQERNLKFQVTKLEQELALARQQNEWLDREIKQKCEEFAGYRNEKVRKINFFPIYNDEFIVESNLPPSN